MNNSEKKINDILSLIFPKKKSLKENIEEKNIIDYINSNYESDELKKIIEKKINIFLSKEYDYLSDYFDEKINALLIKQEKIFIKNEMLKQKVFYLEKYLKDYLKTNNIENMSK